MDTRDIDGRSTLLHHIAQHMRSTLDAQLCRFAAHDMYHCQLAARINPDELQKLVTLLAANIKKVAIHTESSKILFLKSENSIFNISEIRITNSSRLWFLFLKKKKDFS